MVERTEYAPAERATWDEIYAQMSTLMSHSVLQERIQTTNEVVMLLNTQRQIVYVNDTCLNMLGIDDSAELYASRPGEALQCIHADKGAGGCGTSRHCRVCGAANAVMNSLKGKVDVQQCTIYPKGASAPLKLITFTIPIHLKDQRFVLVSLLDQNATTADTSALAKHAFKVQDLAASIEHS